jgi:hypothetical protein
MSQKQQGRCSLLAGDDVSPAPGLSCATSTSAERSEVHAATMNYNDESIGHLQVNGQRLWQCKAI